MRPSPAEEYQRLARTYADMSDGELINLAATFSDLTELAQPILRDEMKRRNLGDPTAPSPAAFRIANETARMPGFDDKSPVFGRWNQAVSEQNGELDPQPVDVADQDPDAEDSGLPVEYTWKTMLCQCNEREEAWQVSEALKRAGIECWIDGPRSAQSLDVRKPFILVAADQLEEARAVIAQPIPQDIIDQSKVKVEDFVLPTCPKCGADDPLLESVDPTNTWLCENCGAHWTDSTALDAAATENPR